MVVHQMVLVEERHLVEHRMVERRMVERQMVVGLVVQDGVREVLVVQDDDGHRLHDDGHLRDVHPMAFRL